MHLCLLALPWVAFSASLPQQPNACINAHSLLQKVPGSLNSTRLEAILLEEEHVNEERFLTRHEQLDTRRNSARLTGGIMLNVRNTTSDMSPSMGDKPELLNSENLFSSPVPWRILAILGLCGFCVIISTLSSCQLAHQHFCKGQDISGNAIPIKRAVDIVAAIWAIPFFGICAVFSLLTPESVLLWRFLLSLVMASVMMAMPRIYEDAIGGTDRLIHSIEKYSGEPLALYSSAPCCCMSMIFKPKAPELLDIRKLKLGVLQFCLVQPLLAFVELFLSVEALHHVSFFAVYFNWRAPWLTLVKVSSNLVAMSCCAGFANLCESMDGHVGKGNLLEKRSYVQSFLLSLNLFPALMQGCVSYFLHDVALSNGARMKPQDQTLWATQAIVCVCTVYISRTASKAFPTDDATLYPEGMHRREEVL